MKKLLAILIHLIYHLPKGQLAVVKSRDTDEETWQHLDGAEFLAILPDRKVATE